MYVKKYVTKNFIFNEPEFDLSNIYKYKKQLIFIDKEMDKNDKDNYIPCLFFPLKETRYFLLYFHGNSEDIFQSELIGSYLKSYLNMNIILIEYPGYSIYKSNKKEPNHLFNDSIKVFNWVLQNFNINSNNIFICGRSLGTSIALYLSSKMNPRALILISPFRSMKSVGENKWYSLFIEDIFNSEDYIKDVNCHILFIHGQKDNIIPYDNSTVLFQKCNQEKSRIKLPEKMEHNKFDIINDIIENILLFIKEFSLCDRKENLLISNEDIAKLFQFPEPISKWIEEELFSISKFSKKDIVLKGSINTNKKVNYLLNLLDGRIAVTFDDIIVIIEEKYYNIEYEMDYHKETIFHISQMKNGILISCSSDGEIIFSSIGIDNFKVRKKLIENSIIYKGMELKNGLICICSKNEIFLLDNNFSKLFSMKNHCNCHNFIETTNNILIFPSKEKALINVYELLENKDNKPYLKEKWQITHLDISYSNDNLCIVNKGILIGGNKTISFLDNNLDYEIKYDIKINSPVKCMAKFNENILLLGCENYICQYNPTNNLISYIKINGTVYSILIQKINKFLITNQESISLYTISKNENCSLI